MPGVNGRELAGRLRVFRPGMKILFMSAHSAETVEHFGVRLAPESFPWSSHSRWQIWRARSAGS